MPLGIIKWVLLVGETDWHLQATLVLGISCKLIHPKAMFLLATAHPLNLHLVQTPLIEIKGPLLTVGKPKIHLQGALVLETSRKTMNPKGIQRRTPRVAVLKLLLLQTMQQAIKHQLLSIPRLTSCRLETSHKALNQMEILPQTLAVHAQLYSRQLLQTTILAVKQNLNIHQVALVLETSLKKPLNQRDPRAVHPLRQTTH